jgi:integrase
LRTLRVGDLSFGDVPFIALRAFNEKNRKGSTIPLRDDLADDLKGWTSGKAVGDRVFDVPAGLLRIFDRDLVAAGIDKVDERGRRVHLHALRMSTGTHLSAAGVSPRTAQAVMRHSDIKLTMATYTDERLLDSAGAVALLPHLPIDATETEAASGRKPMA